MTDLVGRVVAICAALDKHRIPWALGGALALAFATAEPRGTRDIDVNVFVGADQARMVFEALPRDVRYQRADITAARREDQVRLWWDDTPVDIFFAADRFHHDVADRCVTVPFSGRNIRVLCAEDLAVFKAMFDRSQDWVDIETMAAADAIDLEVAATRLQEVLGDDPRVARLRTVAR